MRQLLLCLLCICSCLHVQALETDSLQVSLLTVKPRSNEVYTVFGHTALRLHEPERNLDVVFNWGTFNFNEPNFIFRFVKGETDYYLSTADYNHFCYAYVMGNSTIIEQVLDLTAAEKATVVRLLDENLLPENRVYRYNFLFDNCTSRVRDIIDQACGGNLKYPPERTSLTTYRQLIHSCTEPYPWLTFGIDLVIGSGADSLIHLRQEMFLPERLMDTMDQSFVKDKTGHSCPLVSSTRVIMESDAEKSPKLYLWDSPAVVGSILFLIVVGFLFWGYRKNRLYRIPFSLLFFLAFCGGSIIAFLGLCSVHPCVWPNWNLLWLHPLHLIPVIGYFFKKTYPLFYWYHVVNFVLLCGLLAAWFLLPQEFNAANIPYLLTLLSVSGYTALSTKRKKRLDE